MVRALASHQCGPGSTPGPGVLCGLSLLLVLVLAPGGFSPGNPVFPSPQKPTFLNSNSIWTQWTKSHLVDVPLLLPIYLFIHLFISEEYEQLNDNSCPVDCEKVSYEAHLSTALYLPQKLLPLRKYSKLKEAKQMPNDTDGMVNFIL